MNNTRITALAALLPPPPVALPSRPLPFPLDTLPPPVRSYVERAAAETRVPVGAVAAPLLAFTGGIIGSQLRLQVAPGWTERPVLWIALVGASGSGKTPAIRAARAPLDHLRYLQTYVSAVVDPLYITDSTLAGIISVAEHKRGITLIRDELFGLIRQMRRHGCDERQRFLSLWSSEPIASAHGFERQLSVPYPVVSLVGGIQPLLIPKFRSAEHDGLIERFLPVYLALQQPYWTESGHLNTPIADPALVATLLRQLRAVSAATNIPAGLTITQSPEAATVWAHWYNDNVDQMATLPLQARGFAAKLPSHVARLALVLHALWHPTETGQSITADTMIHATQIGEYFRSHIALTLHLLNEQRNPAPATPALRNRVNRVLAESTAPDGWLSRTQLRLAAGKPPAAELDVAIKQLHDAGIIESRSRRTASARRPITDYRLTRR